jgi:superfamily I DNA and/or RNA helicase
MNREEHLLCCALTFKHAKTRETPLDEEFRTIEEGVRTMTDVLMHEAHHTFQKPVQVPTTPYLHSVDIDTEEPGIVAAKEKVDVVRRKLPLPRVRYDKSTVSAMTTTASTVRVPKVAKTMEKATGAAQKEEARRIKAEESRAKREEVREAAKRERKEMLDNETPEDKKERVLREKKERADKKMKRDAEKAAKEESRDGSEPAPAKKEKAVTTIDEEILASQPMDQITDRQAKKRCGKMQFFENPVPHDRHLQALQRCAPPPHIEPVLLGSVPHDSFCLINGPPGTGKTTTLLKTIQAFDHERILVCSPTNVGAANLYSKCLDMGFGKAASLVLPKERIPVGTPLLNVDPTARIVCCTISGRDGRHLVDESFSIVCVDEAGQCTEPWIWGLMRPDVQRVYLAGDTKQLPATVSESGKILAHDRSLFGRLIERGYPSKRLIVQNRMHPEIVSLPNKLFYDLELKNGELPKSMKHTDAYEVIQVDSREEVVGTSFVNTREATVVAEQARKLQQTYENVVIIAPYTAQCSRLLAQQTGICIYTVDSFQGREADAVVLSMVRTGSDVGFWEDERRLTVALTRARKKLVIVGNTSSWTCKHLMALHKDATKRKLVTSLVNK